MTAGKKLTDEELLFDVELLTIQQVATWAKVSTKSIYRWIEARKDPGGENWGTYLPYTGPGRHRTAEGSRL